MIKKAVIPIAGLGSRFLPASKACAKELFPVVNVPALLHILKECADSGIEEVLLVVSPNKFQSVTNFLKQDLSLEKRLAKDGKLGFLELYNDVLGRLSIDIEVQKQARGSGDAILVAENWVDGEPFAVLFGDDLNYTPDGMRPAIGQCIKSFETTGRLVIGCKTVDMNEIHKYSSCILERQIDESTFEVSGIIEKPKKGEAPSNLAGLARYVLTPDVFDAIRMLPQDTAKEIGLTDAMDFIAKTKGAVACNFESIRYDTGDKFGFVQATIEYGLRDPEIADKLAAYLQTLTKEGISSKSDDVEIYETKNVK